MVLGTEKGYYPINFSWEDFDWSENPESLIEIENFVQKLNFTPVFEKAKIICVGRNYADHAKELGNEVPTEPILFWKPHSSLIGPNGLIELPSQSSNVQYETELVAVIGKKGKNISIEESMDFVIGYTIGLDITARDLQRSDKTWFRGKSFDTFSPVGPVIVPKNKINLDNCSVQLTVNEELKQNGNTRDFIFKLPFLIHYISQIITLEPGDIIFTGTPEGVGTIKSGDVLKASIQGIGELTVSVR